MKIRVHPQNGSISSRKFRNVQILILQFGILLVILFLFGCKKQSSQKANCQMRIAAASSLTLPLQQMIRSFKESTSCRIWLDLGSSGLLRRKIERGAPTSVYLSASAFQMKQLQQKKLLIKKSLRTFATNQLVLVVPHHSQSHRLPTIAACKAWLQQPNRRIAIGDPLHVPAGRYARIELRHMKLWSDMQKRIIQTQHVRAALHTIRQGHLAGAFIFRSDAYTDRHHVRVLFQFAKRSDSPILYQAVILKQTSNLELAKRFIQHLLSEKSLQVLKTHGFGSIDSHHKNGKQH